MWVRALLVLLWVQEIVTKWISAIFPSSCSWWEVDLGDSVFREPDEHVAFVVGDIIFFFNSHKTLESLPYKVHLFKQS